MKRKKSIRVGLLEDNMGQFKNISNKINLQILEVDNMLKKQQHSSVIYNTNNKSHVRAVEINGKKLRITPLKNDINKTYHVGTIGINGVKLGVSPLTDETCHIRRSEINGIKLGIQALTDDIKKGRSYFIKE